MKQLNAKPTIIINYTYYIISDTNWDTYVKPYEGVYLVRRQLYNDNQPFILGEL